MRIYLDTSAAMKLVVADAQSEALVHELERLPAEDLVLASWLLHTELHCAAARQARAIPGPLITAVLEAVTLVDLVRADLLDAPRRGTGQRSQDALHLTVAARIGCDAILTYDDEQAGAARALGIEVLQPV